jgi:hypothetical protein
LEIVYTGIGPRNAEAVLRPILQQGRPPPRLVISCGFAGGLNPDLAAGKVLFEADPGFPLSTALVESGAQPGRFHAVSHVAGTASSKCRLRRSTQADALDMESGVIRELCRADGIPSATVRVISDSAEENLPLDFNRLFTPDWRLDGRRLAWTLIRSPRSIGRLLRFQSRLRLAERNLAGVLQQTLKAYRS